MNAQFAYQHYYIITMTDQLALFKSWQEEMGKISAWDDITPRVRELEASIYALGHRAEAMIAYIRERCLCNCQSYSMLNWRIRQILAETGKITGREAAAGIERDMHLIAPHFPQFLPKFGDMVLIDVNYCYSDYHWLRDGIADTKLVGETNSYVVAHVANYIGVRYPTASPLVEFHIVADLVYYPVSRVFEWRKKARTSESTEYVRENMKVYEMGSGQFSNHLLDYYKCNLSIDVVKYDKNRKMELVDVATTAAGFPNFPIELMEIICSMF